MAATLTDDLTRVSVADIEKWEEDGDTLYVYGKCTTPEVDTDDQVVDSGWSGPALKEYMAIAPTVRVQHNAQRDPAGSAVRVDVNRDGDGSHWLKAAVDEPVAQRLVKKGHLRAFSVGIARPVIERDITGKARGGIIKGGKIVEVSLVDSPANRSCFLELAKSAADGTPEFTGKMVADDDVIQKALDGDLLTKDGAAAVAAGAQKQAYQAGYFPGEDLNITFTPNDLARMVKSKFVQQHYDELAAQAVTEKRDFDPGVGGGVDRDKLPASSFAGPHRSFPVVNQSDVSDAMHLAGHAADPDQVRANVKRIANREGLSVPGEDDSKNKGTEEVTGPVAAKEAGPDLTKSCSACSGGNCDGASCSCGNCAGGKCACGKPAEKGAGEPGPKPAPVRKAKKPKKMPPWLNKPKDDDGDSDDSKGDGDSGSCKSATGHDWPEYWVQTADGPKLMRGGECKKCHTTPAQAAGVTASAMDPAPVGELMESNPPPSVKGATPQSAGGVKDAPAMQPVPAHREPDGPAAEALEADAGMSDGDSEQGSPAGPAMKASPEVMALLRFKSTGTDPELGKLHDLTCPAYHPDEVAKYHPFADLTSLIDEAHWQRKALDAACGPLEHAIAMQELTGAALALKAASAADVNDWRLEAHKAFRDANPGPGTYPSPGAVSPQKYKRPLITDGRSATSAGHSGPNTSPVVAAVPPNAQNFDRPPLAAAHASPSPSFMKWDSGQYPSAQGVPTQLNYAHLEKDKQRMALVQMHDHLSRQFPEVCPLDNVDLSGRTDRPLRGVQPEHHPVPAAAGIGKAEGAEVLKSEAPALGAYLTDVSVTATKNTATPVAASFKAEPETGADFFADADVYKGFKKMRKKLGKKVLSGSMTVDEARAKMGRQFAQKGAGEEQEAAQKAISPVTSTLPGAEVTYRVSGGVDPDVIKAAVREALRAETVPLEASEIKAFDPSPAIEAAVTKAVTPLLEKIQAQDTRLAETQRVIDAIADQPDPSTAAFSGVAFQPVRKTARPAGVTDIAEAAARARRATERELETLYESASDPFAREGFYSALNKVRGGGA